MFSQYQSSIKEMQVRLFRVLVGIACFANLVGFILNAALQGNTLPTQITFISSIFILIFSIWGVCTPHKTGASIGILLTVVWIEFPILYAVYGSIILVYFILSIVGIIIFSPRKFSLIFCVLTFIWDVFVMVYVHFNPIEFYTISDEGMLVFSIVTYLIPAVACLVLLNVLIQGYEKQKKELRRKNAELDNLAIHDSLTKLYNRGYLMSEIEARMQENAKFVAVIVDVDNFKQINDTYGHSFGDKVLVTFAQLMEKEVEGKGFAARFGGEEFMIIYDHDNLEEAKQGLQDLAARLKKYFQKENQVEITFSGGIELYNGQKKKEQLIISVDNKLYEAKAKGKGQIVG